MERAWRVVFVALCVQLLAAAANADTPSQRYGVVAGWDGNVEAKFSDLGIGLLRTPCNWGDMEDYRGHFVWGCSDARIYGPTADGYEVLLTAQCTPSWARSGGDCNTQPDNMNDWYDFVAAFVTHYSGYNVVLGIYNEPNISLPGASAMSTGQYCGYATTAMAARDAYNSGFRLAMPETNDGAYGNGWFYNAMNCIRTYATLRSQDVITVHWYSGGPTMSTYLDYVRANSGGGNDVWLSETGYSASDQWAQSNFYGARLNDFETLALSRPWWKKLVFYSLYDGADGEGIVNADQTPRIAYNNLKNWVGLTTVPTMTANQYLYPNQYVTSSGGDYILIYQSDGNLVLYDRNWNYAGWNSGTVGDSAGFTVMQGDGNFVVYDATTSAVWWSGTVGHPGAYLVVQYTGQMWIFDADGTPIWYY